MKYLLRFILITLVTISLYLFYDSVLVDKKCYNLQHIAQNDVQNNQLKDWVYSLLVDPSVLKTVDKEIGTIFIGNIKGHLGLDLDELNIPLASITVELVGKGINYQNIDKRNVDFARVGYGYRKHIIYRINDLFDLKSIALQYERMIFLSGDVLVGCN
jgi:hypothetical protein